MVSFRVRALLVSLMVTFSVHPFLKIGFIAFDGLQNTVFLVFLYQGNDLVLHLEFQGLHVLGHELAMTNPHIF